MNRRLLLAIIFILFLFQNGFSSTLWERIMEEQSYIELKKGILFFENKDYLRASQEFLKSISIKQTPLAYTLYGASLYWLGDTDGSIESYDKAIQIDPKYDVAWQLKGISYARGGNIHAAVECFTQALSLNPLNADTMLNLSSSYLALGNITKAKDYVKKAIKIDHKNPLFHFQLGMIHFYEGNLTDAHISFKNAYSLKSDYEEAILWDGITFEKMNMLKEAKKNYKKAIAIKPYDNFARYRLALTLYKSGDFDKDIILPCFELFPKSNDYTSFSISYQPSKSQKIQVSDLLSDVVKDIGPGSEVIVELSAIEQSPPVFENKQESLNLKNALSKKFNPKLKIIQKTYTLKFLNQKQIEDEIKKISEEIRNISNMSERITISVRVQKYFPSKFDDEQAVYVPRNIGNDMGLWLYGNPWIEIVEEDIEGGILDKEGVIINGVGYLLIGDIKNASELFKKSENYDKVISYLGLGVVEYLSGNKKDAWVYFKKVLEIDPKNRVANKNLKVMNYEYK